MNSSMLRLLSLYRYHLPIVGLFQSLVFVAESVELEPDDDGDVVDAVLPVEALPGRVADVVVPGHQRVLEADRQPTRGKYCISQPIRG